MVKKILLELAAENGDLDIFKYLFKNSDGPNVSKALHAAANKGHLNIVQYLVENCGADIADIKLAEKAALMGNQFLIVNDLYFNDTTQTTTSTQPMHSTPESVPDHQKMSSRHDGSQTQ